jgi:hypothetical protein
VHNREVNIEKKDGEQRILTAARPAGAPIPMGELPGEVPDFRIQTPTGILGVEVSEVLRPASTNDGILPVAEESFHQSIMLGAQEICRKTGEAPVHVVAYFSRAKGEKQDKRRLTESLVECVAANRHRANPAVVLKDSELPEGFDHILINTINTAGSGDWWSGEGGGIELSQIRTQLASCISAKNKLVPAYRANLPKGGSVWLLLYSRPTVARSVPIPYGIEQWGFPIDFDRVFWYACLENQVVEIREPQRDTATKT